MEERSLARRKGIPCVYANSFPKASTNVIAAVTVVSRSRVLLVSNQQTRCQLSLMRGFIRRLGVYVWHTTVCMAVLGLVLSMFWAVSYALSVHHRRQAEQMLRQLGALEPGATSFRTVRRIAKDSGGKEYCTEESCRYDFDNSFNFSDSWPQRALGRTEWDYFGLRPWRVSAVIRKKNTEPANLQFTIMVGRGRGWLMNEGLFSGNMWGWLVVSVTADPGRFEQRLKLEKEYDSQHSLATGDRTKVWSDGVIVIKPNVDTPGGGQALDVYLSPSAPPESRKLAFDLNLRCATAMSPCSELCQLAPSAWRSYVQFTKSNGWSVGEPTDCAANSQQ